MKRNNNNQSLMCSSFFCFFFLIQYFGPFMSSSFIFCHHTTKQKSKSIHEIINILLQTLKYNNYILNHWMKKNHHYYHKLHLHVFSQLSNNKIIIIHNLIIYRIMFWFYKHDFASSFHWYFLTFTSKTMSKIIWFQSCTMLVSNIVTHLYVHFTLFFSFRISYTIYIFYCAKSVYTIYTT